VFLRVQSAVVKKPSRPRRQLVVWVARSIMHTKNKHTKNKHTKNKQTQVLKYFVQQRARRKRAASLFCDVGSDTSTENHRRITCRHWLSAIGTACTARALQQWVGTVWIYINQKTKARLGPCTCTDCNVARRCPTVYTTAKEKLGYQQNKQQNKDTPA